MLTEALSTLGDTELDAIADALANGVDPVEILNLYGIYNTLIARLPDALLPPLVTAAHHALDGIKIGNIATIPFSFNMTDPRATSWAANQSSNLVVAIDHEIRMNIRTVLGRSFTDGVKAIDTARALREVVGLTPQWTNAVYNFQAGLIDAGAEPAYVDKAVSRYSRHLLKVRTETIARTELHSAMGAGRMLGWQQAAETGLFDAATATKEWIAEDNACEWCLEAETRGPIALEDVWVFRTETHEMNPLHPNCKCAVVLHPDG